MQTLKSDNSPLLHISQPTGRNWQVGQIVHATVISTAQGKTVLNIAGNLITSSLTMERPWQEGEKIQLEVLKTGMPVVLKVSPSDPAQELIISRALREQLPRQMPLGNMLNNLSPLLNSGSVNPATQQMIARLLATIPQLKQLTSGKKVKQAVINSGMFLENKLVQPQSSSSSISQDFKAALLRLLGSLKNAPEQAGSTTQPTVEAIRQIEAGLARVQTNQLNTITSHGTEWFIELPVKLKNEQQLNELKIKIRKNKEAENRMDHPIWSVFINFELQELGPVQANITLLGTNRISIGIWAEQESTAKQFTNQLDMLRASLAEADLTILNLSSHHGKSPESGVPESSIGQQLIDITV